MRSLRKNQQKLLYSNQSFEMPIYETDDEGNVLKYVDDDGNEYPLAAGETEVLYKEPIPFRASVSMSGGEAEAVEYGLSTADYSAIAILGRGEVPLTEGTLIWLNSEPVYKYGGEEVSFNVNDEDISGRFVEKTSADYVVMKLSPSLNVMKVILTAVNK